MYLPGRINDMYFSCSGHLKYLPEHMVLLLTLETFPQLAADLLHTAETFPQLIETK
jgi:hypothetical protein